MIFVALWEMEGEVRTCFQNIRQNSWRLVSFQTGIWLELLDYVRMFGTIRNRFTVMSCGINESITNCLEVLGNKWRITD